MNEPGSVSDSGVAGNGTSDTEVFTSQSDSNYTDVFLNDRYIRLQFLRGNLDPHQLSMQKAMLLQQRIQENCILKASVIGIGSAMLGALVGSLFFSMDTSAITADSSTDKKPPSFGTQIKGHFRQLIPQVKSSAKNFAKLGFVYSLFECCIQKGRGKSDLYNSMYAGCASGAMLAIKGGPISACGGCVGFAAFSTLIDAYTRSKYTKD